MASLLQGSAAWPACLGGDTAKAFTEVFEGCCLDAGVEFMFDTEANGLLLARTVRFAAWTATASDGHVLEIHARSVVLGTGGFGGDDELLRRYAPWIPTSALSTKRASGR